MMYTNDNTHNVLYFWVLDVPEGGIEATEMGACTDKLSVAVWELHLKVQEFSTKGDFKILPFGGEHDVHMMLDGVYGHIYIGEM